MNLHLLVCRLHLQEQQRGAVYLELEYWVERVIQLGKSKVRYRTHEYPEKVLANYLLEASAIANYEAEFPRVRQLAALMDGETGTRVQNLDSSDDGTHMLGTGRQPTCEEWEEIQPALLDFCKRESEHDGTSHWATVDGSSFRIGDVPPSSDVKVFVYSSANLRGEEIITSTEHKRSRTRQSCYVTTTYQVGEQIVTYVAVVRKLVKLVHLVDGVEHCLRFSLCDFFRRMPPGNRVQYLVDVKDPDLGDMWKVMHASEDRCLSDKNYLVEMASIATKVVMCKKDNGDTLHFLSYQFSSGFMLDHGGELWNGYVRVCDCLCVCV